LKELSPTAKEAVETQTMTTCLPSEGTFVKESPTTAKEAVEAETMSTPQLCQEAKLSNEQDATQASAIISEESVDSLMLSASLTEEARRTLYPHRLDAAQYQCRFIALSERPASLQAGLPPNECQLEHGSLLSPPPYTALSYVWGGQPEPTTLLVNGLEMRVTQSLRTAIDAMWDAGEKMLWIDQLCLNQDDSVEKSNQVLRMIGLVYENADRWVRLAKAPILLWTC
jgi:hypothetical protein